MRAFCITLCLALAAAAPQYNYQQPSFSTPVGFPKLNRVPEEQSLLNDVLQNPQLSQAILGTGPSASQQVNFQQQPIGFGSGLRQQFVPQIQQIEQSAQLQPQQQQFNFQAAPLAPLAPVVTKDIYVHAAPEEPEEKFNAPPPRVLPPRKHYRIVFIKAPTQRVNTAALRVTQAPTEEKTIIYVLSKKPEPLDLQTVIQDAAPRQPSKPEVYFIKYKTQEEAAHAQRSIQAQFDALGGSSAVSDEGIAPVTSVIGSLQNQQQISLPGIQQETNLIGSGSNLNGNQSPTYLPPSH